MCILLLTFDLSQQQKNVEELVRAFVEMKQANKEKDEYHGETAKDSSYPTFIILKRFILKSNLLEKHKSIV